MKGARGFDIIAESVCSWCLMYRWTAAGTNPQAAFFFLYFFLIHSLRRHPRERILSSTRERASESTLWGKERVGQSSPLAEPRNIALIYSVGEGRAGDRCDNGPDVFRRYGRH